MPDRQNIEALFLDNLAWIERVAASVCRRHGLAGEDAEDFASWAKMKLVEDDYAALRKFRGESSVTTYLTVVVSMLFRDYRAAHWGRWRPSAAARRHGPVAVRLETLVHRDGYRLEQASEILRTSGETELSDRQLASLLAELPERAPLRPVEVGPDPLQVTPAGESADEGVIGAEVEEERRAAGEALSRAMEGLPAEERLILRMRFWEGLGVADIARGLGLPQKPLYRRIERSLARLREHLEAGGVSRERVRALLGESGS